MTLTARLALPLACSLILQSQSAPILWRDPGPIAEKNLAQGPTSAERAPKPPFTFLEEDLSGSKPKVKVTDANGVVWKVKFAGTERTVTDGPFAETKELVAGFWLWEVKSMEDAVSWLKRAPFDGGTEVEIRPVFETDDFGDLMTPELRAQEERLRAQIAAKP